VRDARRESLRSAARECSPVSSRVLRWGALGSLAFALLAGAGGAFAHSRVSAHSAHALAAGGSAVDEQQSRVLLKAMNAVRAHAGLQPLEFDLALVRAAEAQSLDMAAAGKMTHGRFAERILASGAPGRVFGENIASTTERHPLAQAVVRRWLDSPGHRANLLDAGFARVGIAVAYGTVDGRRTAAMVTAAFAGS
jgi:uncharacterized protein YkwD